MPLGTTLSEAVDLVRRIGIGAVASAALPTFLADWVGYAVADIVSVIASAALTTAAYWQLRELERASVHE